MKKTKSKKVDESKFGHGAIKSPKDKRDFKYDNIARATTPFDWVKGYDVEEKVGEITTDDQNGSGSCGGQAVGYFMDAIEALETGDLEKHSKKYTYAQCAVPGGGSTGRCLFDVVVKQGVSLESLCPSYENGKPPTEAFMARYQDITDKARADATTSQAVSYARVNITMDSLAQALKDNGGVMVGLYGLDNGTWHSTFPKNPGKINGTWAHWLFLGKAKLIDGKKFIGVKNSWGNVGDKGWQYLGEDYIPYIFEAWTMVFKPIVNGKYIFVRDVFYGDRSEDVKQLQKRMNFPESLCTGYFGVLTKACLFWFQAKNNITPTGWVDADTRKVLNK